MHSAPGGWRSHVGSDEGDNALGPYLRAIRARWLTVLLVTTVTVAAAFLLLVKRGDTYEATSEVLVTPLSQQDQTFVGLQLLRDTNDPTRIAQTAATVLSSPEAAARTARRLGDGLTRGTVEDGVKVEPLGESNILGITARAGDPGLSARLANAYADAALAVRAEDVARQINSAIETITNPVGDERRRLANLRAARNRGDPTMSLSQRATVPRTPTGAPPWLVLALASIAGFALAVATAVLMERADRRVRNVRELLDLLPFPVLARVPSLPRRFAGRTALDVPPAVREAFRTLQIQLDQGERRPAGRVVMITSGTSGDGKTTSALQLGAALVGAGHRVILMDFDMRKPEVEKRLGLGASRGLVTMLSSGTHLADILQPAPGLAPLRVVTAAVGPGDVVLLQVLSRRMDEILDEARELADYVIMDTAPLGEVGDALVLTSYVDDVLVIGRVGHTERRAVEQMAALLERAGAAPTGWVFTGDDDASRTSYEYLGMADAAVR